MKHYDKIKEKTEQRFISVLQIFKDLMITKNLSSRQTHSKKHQDQNDDQMIRKDTKCGAKVLHSNIRPQRFFKQTYSKRKNTSKSERQSDEPERHYVWRKSFTSNTKP